MGLSRCGTASCRSGPAAALAALGPSGSHWGKSAPEILRGQKPFMCFFVLCMVLAYLLKKPWNFGQLFLMKGMDVCKFSGMHVS